MVMAPTVKQPHGANKHPLKFQSYPPLKIPSEGIALFCEKTFQEFTGSSLHTG
jgi:hypothetical protein